MIDASKGFMKDGNKNRLRHQDIHKIVDVFNRQVELPKYSHMVDMAEIEANDYNLNIRAILTAANLKICRISRLISREAFPTAISTAWKGIGMSTLRSNRNCLRKDQEKTTAS